VQFRKASEILERRLTEDNPGFVSIVAMVETVWVLGSAYGFPGRGIAVAIERMRQADVLVVESEFEVFTAMIAAKEGRGSFADAMISGLGAKANCSCALTFDEKALPLPGFELP
jgi:predicted nucleic-acid-binding protein